MENGLTALLISDESYPLEKLDEEEKTLVEDNDEDIEDEEEIESEGEEEEDEEDVEEGEEDEDEAASGKKSSMEATGVGKVFITIYDKIPITNFSLRSEDVSSRVVCQHGQLQ